MYQTIFFPMINYPSPTLPASIATVIALAKEWDAHVNALNSEAPAPTGLGTSAAMPFIGTMIEAERAKARSNAEAVVSDFERQANEAGIRHDIIKMRHEVFDPSAWESPARYAALSVLFVEEGSGLDEWCAEAVIFGSGRPSLVFPKKAEAQTLRCRRVAVAWDGSRAAARAVGDAMPALRQAEETKIFIAAPDKDPRIAHSDWLTAYLHRSGVSASAEIITTGTGDAADVLTAATQGFNADLLVMGAYGHSGIRNFILGGVTERILRSPPLPVLLSH